MSVALTVQERRNTAGLDFGFIKLRKKDEIGLYLQQMLKTFRVLRFVAVGAIVVSLLSTGFLYFTMTRPDTVVLLDGFGKTYVVETTPDNKFFNSEVQFFIGQIVSILFDRAYTDFLDQAKVEQIITQIKPFFMDETFDQFWRSYINSHYVKSLLSQKAYTRVKELPPFDYIPNPQIDRKILEKYKPLVVLQGKIQLTTVTVTGDKTSSASGGSETTSYKNIVVGLVKRGRTPYNPYGLYVYLLYEK